ISRERFVCGPPHAKSATRSIAKRERYLNGRFRPPDLLLGGRKGARRKRKPSWRRCVAACSVAARLATSHGPKRRCVGWAWNRLSAHKAVPKSLESVPDILTPFPAPFSGPLGWPKEWAYDDDPETFLKLKSA